MSRQQLFESVFFELPRGWEDRTTYKFVGPEPENLSLGPTLSTAQKLRPNLVVTKTMLEEGRSLADFCDEQLGQIKSNVPGFKLKNRADEMMEGIKGVRLHLSFQFPPTGLPIEQVHIYLPRGKAVIGLIYSFLPGNTKGALEELERMVESMSFD